MAGPRTEVTLEGESRRSIFRQARDLVGYRELLVGLVRRELKVRYKNSALGFFWSMLNPALYLAVFWVVFGLILPAGIPKFPIFLLSGLLVWNLWLTGLVGATGSIVSSQSLVNKVYFPREVLPLTSIGAATVHFFLQAVVLIAALVVFRYPVPWSWVWLIVPALVVLLLLTTALGTLLSAANVYARDTQHLVELALLAWFWITPIVYPYRLVSDRLNELTWLYLLNPITPIVVTFQRAIYGTVEATGGDSTIRPRAEAGQPILPDVGQGWYLRNLAIVGAVSLLLLVVAGRIFDRVSGDLAEEL